MKPMRFLVNIEYNGVSPWYVDAYSPEDASNKAKLLFRKESGNIGGSRTIQFIQEPKNLEENANNPLFPWNRIGENSFYAHLSDLPKGTPFFNVPYFVDGKLCWIDTPFRKFQICDAILPEVPSPLGIAWVCDYANGRYDGTRHIILHQ